MLLLVAALVGAADPSAEFSFTAGAATRGERRVEATARASSGEVALTLGATDLAGPRAPERQEMLFAAKLGVLAGEVRAMPSSAGLSRIGAEAGVHFESVSLVLGARTASLGHTELRGAGARLELEGDLAEGLRAGLGASAWALQLEAPSSRNAWTTWGNLTLDWPQRAEAGAWISRDFAELFSLTPSLSAGQSAQPGVYELRGSLAVEVPLGPVKLRAEPALARQWPQLWLFDFSAGLTLAL